MKTSLYTSSFYRQMRTMKPLLAIMLFISASFITELRAQETGTVTDYDGNSYKTVKIGEQWWMAENLKVTHYADGTEITLSTTTKTTSADDYKVYYKYPNNDASLVAEYGLLYSWSTMCNQQATTMKDFCPEGWRVPDVADWELLAQYCGGMSVAGGKLKSTSIYWTSPNAEATNAYQFNALPAGDCNTGGFTQFGTQARFWTPQLVEATGAGRYYMYIDYNSGALAKGSYRNVNTLSIRCIKKSVSTSSTKVEKPNAANFYINSATNQLVISGLSEATSIRLFSIDGTLSMIIEPNGNDLQMVSAANLKNGIYIFEAHFTDRIISGKIMKKK